MPFEEMAIWNAHFTKRPPDAIERLLAIIAVTMINAHRKENAQAVTVYQLAPWLESPAAKKKREFDEETDYLSYIFEATTGED